MSDYAVCEEDAWDSCISDRGDYVRIQDSISSIARVRAFEEIATLLFDPTVEASAATFLMAREIYQEEEGLDSRVARRFDPHFTVPDGTDCTMPTVAASFPEYCVGPAILQPIVLDALGSEARTPRQRAARVEAALLWFFYVSSFKEATTCTTKPKDCDSSYAYYTGGEPARDGIGLARAIREVDPYAHDRAWDGFLALRCWRDLDPGDVAEDLAMRDRAMTQFDRALLDGFAALLAERLRRAATTTAEEQAYHWEFVRVAAQAIDRSYRERSAADATTLVAALERAPADVDLGSLADALDATYTCP